MAAFISSEAHVMLEFPNKKNRFPNRKLNKLRQSNKKKRLTNFHSL